MPTIPPFADHADKAEDATVGQDMVVTFRGLIERLFSEDKCRVLG